MGSLALIPLMSHIRINMLRNSQCISGVSYAFPNAMSQLQKDGNYEDVFKLYEAVKELPNIKAYLASERRQVYGKGIYRHYPELDE